MSKNGYAVSYAQNREDLLIRAFFEDTKRGFYVDIGANHPTDDSVTKLFYDNGWRGINVEPNARLFSLLQQERPRDTNVQAGISDKAGTLTMREYDGWYAGLSTFSKDMQNENKDVTEYHDIEINVITLRELFKQYNVEKINFLKVDVEGYEYNVLAGNNWDRYRPELICIEANHTFKDWRDLLANARYTKVFFDGLNEYYLAEEAIARQKNFSYVKSIIGNSIVDVRTEKLLHSLEEKLDRQTEETNTLKSEVLRLEREAIEAKRTVQLVKQLFKAVDGKMRRRIEKLNKRKVRMPEQRSLHIEDIEKPAELLTRIQTYDLDVYYMKTWQKDRLVYRITHTTYDALSRLTFKTGKHLLGLIRRLKR